MTEPSLAAVLTMSGTESRSEWQADLAESEAPRDGVHRAATLFAR
jgi:hypothetical protein